MFKGKRGVDFDGVEWGMGWSGQVMKRNEMWTEACREGKISRYWEQGGALQVKGRANVSALLKKKIWPSWRISVRTVWLPVNERKRKRDVGGEQSRTTQYDISHGLRKRVLVYLKGKIWAAFICQRMSRSNLTVMGQSGCYEHNGKHEWKCAKCLGVIAAVKAKEVCS